MVGTEQQSQYLLSEYKQNPQAIWNTNMFGKTMSGLAKDGLEGKCVAMPTEVKEKLTRTVSKIVNENRGRGNLSSVVKLLKNMKLYQELPFYK